MQTLDFKPVFAEQITLNQLCENLTRYDLELATEQMIDYFMAALADCQDEDLKFVPKDPEAEDNTGWTIPHIIVHMTSTAEESAFTAAEMARGVQPADEHRSRYEAPPESLKTVADCLHHLDESRRIRVATLEVWPDKPHLDITMEYPFLQGPLNAKSHYALGLLHDSMHIEQMDEVIQQTKAARS